MNTQNKFLRLVLMMALIAASAFLSACSTEEEQQPVVATEAPPPPLQVENRPFLDSPQTETWRPGYWVLAGNDFAWVPGKVIPRPSPTAVWASARWVEHSYGWSFQQGHWE